MQHSIWLQLRNKRIMEGSLFDIHRPEQSQQQSTPLPPLDAKRAASSQQYVRALNNQFARSISFFVFEQLCVFSYYLVNLVSASMINLDEDDAFSCLCNPPPPLRNYRLNFWDFFQF